MKFFQIFFCTLLSLLLVQANFAQIGKVFDRQGTKLENAGKRMGELPKTTAKRVGNNANNRVNSGIDRKVDRAIDKVLNPRIQRGNQKGTIKVKNSDGSSSERKMTKAEKKALKKQDRADKKKAKKDKRDMVKYGSTDEEVLAEEENSQAEEKKIRKQEEQRKLIIAKYTGASTFRLVRRSANNKMDTFLINGYVNGSRTAVKVRDHRDKDKLIHWCVNDRARQQIDDLQGGKNTLPITTYIQRDDKKTEETTDDTIDTLYKIGSSEFNSFKFEREYKMQTRDSVICAHYFASNDQFEVEIWADESVKTSHFEQFVVDDYVKSPILLAVSLLGKMKVQIREAVVTDKNTNEIFYYTYQSSNTNAPSSSHFKSEEVGDNWDFNGFIESGGLDKMAEELDKILEDEKDEIEYAKMDKKDAEEEAALRKTAKWFYEQAESLKMSMDIIMSND